MHKSLLSIVLAFAMTLLSTQAYAEGKPKVKAEDLVEKPVGGATLENLPTQQRAKVTEEQAIAQLKYMMVNGFKRVEGDLLERGSFKPIGMTLDPDGNFRAIRVDGQEEMPQDVAIEALVKAIQGLAAQRTQWGVGLIYVTGQKTESGEVFKRIVVVTEHIAGWARSWDYPYKIEDGKVMMGQPREQEMQPVYYQR